MSLMLKKHLDSVLKRKAQAPENPRKDPAWAQEQGRARQQQATRSPRAWAVHHTVHAPRGPRMFPACFVWCKVDRGHKRGQVHTWRAGIGLVHASIHTGEGSGSMGGLRSLGRGFDLVWTLFSIRFKSLKSCQNALRHRDLYSQRVW